MNEKQVYENASEAIAFFDEEDILWHMTNGMDEEDVDDFTDRFNKTMRNLRRVHEAFYDLLDPEVRDTITP